MLDLYEWRYLNNQANKKEYLFGYPTYTYKSATDTWNTSSIGSWHWSFYGPFTITVNPTKITCDIDGDGTKTKVPAGFYVGYDQFGTGLFAPTAVNAAANGVVLVDPSNNTATTYFVPTEFGVVTYINNGTPLTKDRHLYVPIKVQYGWGEFEIEVEVLIKSTKNA